MCKKEKVAFALLTFFFLDLSFIHSFHSFHPFPFFSVFCCFSSCWDSPLFFCEFETCSYTLNDFNIIFNLVSDPSTLYFSLLIYINIPVYYSPKQQLQPLGHAGGTVALGSKLCGGGSRVLPVCLEATPPPPPHAPQGQGDAGAVVHLLVLCAVALAAGKPNNAPHRSACWNSHCQQAACHTTSLAQQHACLQPLSLLLGETLGAARGKQQQVSEWGGTGSSALLSWPAQLLSQCGWLASGCHPALACYRASVMCCL